jgi:branched-chain amino acid transport system ATP-binding protein
MLNAGRNAVLDVRGLSAGWGPLRVIHDLDLIVFAG